jgi:hypothetical protein
MTAATKWRVHMAVRTQLAAAVVAAVAAVTVATATAAPPRLHSCGKVSIAGKSWAVLSVAVPCPRAKTLVKKIAAKPHPVTRLYAGTFLGMKCIDASKGGKRYINCLSPKADRQVVGGTGL